MRVDKRVPTSSYIRQSDGDCHTAVKLRYDALLLRLKLGSVVSLTLCLLLLYSKFCQLVIESHTVGNPEK
ncbi:MAG: hypothetical protein AAF984_11060 [Verrucomicrobiota bacterium]